MLAGLLRVETGVAAPHRTSPTAALPPPNVPPPLPPLRPPRLPQREQVKPLHFLPRPGCLAQERQAGLDAGVERETTDGNAPCEFVPAVVRLQRADHGFEGHAVKRVAGLFGRRSCVCHAAILPRRSRATLAIPFRDNDAHPPLRGGVCVM